MRFALFLFLTSLNLFLNAQAPALIPYQAVARDAAGLTLNNATINARFTIHDGTATGAVVWQEVQTVTTSALGLFTVQLGSSVALNGVNWASGNKFIQVELNLGQGFVNLGSQQMLSVPYALYAGSLPLSVSLTGDTLFIGNGEVIIPGLSQANSQTTGTTQDILMGNSRTVDVVGQVFDESGAPLVGATVQAGYGSQAVYTDERGFFRLLNIAGYDNIALVKVSKAGFFEGSRSFVPTDGQSHVRIALLAKNDAGSFSAAAGGQVSLEGLTIDFAPNSISLDGQPFSGNVNVDINRINPEDTWNMAQQMPGSLMGADSIEHDISDGFVVFESLGMAGIELRSNSGQKLQLLAGSTATVSFNVPASLLTDAPTTIPLWYYSESLGYWVREGEATLNGNLYEGEVSHLSFWNCGISVEAHSFTLTLLDAAHGGSADQIEGAHVVITSEEFGSSDGYTDSNGVVSGLVPANNSLEVKVNIICNNLDELIYTATIDPLTADYSTTWSITEMPVGVASVQGQLLQEGQPVDGYVYLENGSYTSTTNGSYELLACTGSGVLTGWTYEGNTICTANTQAVTLVAGVNAFDVTVLNCVTYGQPGPGGIDQEGDAFTSVIIGSQEWMSENLSVASYADGTPIPKVTDQNAWASLTTGAWCWFNNDSATYAASYGRLYNWYTCVDPRLLCPVGWHVPTDAEWSTMINFLDPDADGGVNLNMAGGMMKTTGTVEAGNGLWAAPNMGASNVSGFSGAPGGLRSGNFPGNSNSNSVYGNWWSSSEDGPSYGLIRVLVNNSGTVYRSSDAKDSGFSVRCVKD